jgi:hypothetical protein
VNVTDAYLGTATSLTNVTVIFDFTVAITSAPLVGQPFEVAVHTEGGLGAIHYAYTELPPGCAAGDVSSFACVPTRAGHFTIGITVTDEAFDSAHHDVPVQVGIPVIGATAPSVPSLNLTVVFGLVALVATGLVALGGWRVGRPPPKPNRQGGTRRTADR